MNERVLELLKAPKNIQSEDLGLLKQEIDSYPYIQNIRALYLYGVYRYDQGNYQKVLSTTAAYTTDKKILYQLINGKIQPKPKPEATVPVNLPETVVTGTEAQENARKPKMSGFPLVREETSAVSASDDQPEEKSGNPGPGPGQEERILPLPKPESKPVYVNGELNRILFEGEETFLEDEDVETIDLESTLESGSIVTQKINKAVQSAAMENTLPRKDHDHSGPADYKADEAISEAGKDKRAAAGENISSNENVDNSGITEGTENLPVGEKSKEHQENSENTGDDETAEEPGSTTTESENLSFDERNTDHAERTSATETESAETGTLPEDAQEVDTAVETGSAERFTAETVIREEEITSGDQEKVLDDTELSFQETEPIMPQTSIGTSEEPDQSAQEESLTEAAADGNEKAAFFTPEKIIDEDKIPEEKETLHDESQLSFHGTESFMPQVSIQPDTKSEAPEQPLQPNINKHEEEMRRLIEEVEKKMKERAAAEKAEKQPEPEPRTTDGNISYAETRPAGNVSTQEKEKEQAEAASETLPEEMPEQVGTHSKETEDQSYTDEVHSAWKPMAFQSNLPDSLLDRATEEKESIQEKEQPAEDPVEEEVAPVSVRENEAEAVTMEAPAEEAPVMNVSFFGSGWTIAQPQVPEEKNDPEADEAPVAQQKEITEEPEKVKPVQATAQPLDSNVPGFINTWQSWLKIDRTEEVQKEKTEIKAKVIEAFIENNPKISQLKDESTFIVKEKGDDISHLMTETLANLYFEQKLYTKAIKAFEILIKKSPDKEEYFKGKIQEIKDFRTK